MAAVTAAVCVTAGCWPASTTAADATSQYATARVDLTRIPIVDAASIAGAPTYRRAAFGPAWQSTSGSPCRTRDQVLARTLQQPVYRAGSACVLIAGSFTDPYTGASVTFTKAQAADVQIDHVIPLALAWRLGAFAWSDQQRVRFANDLTTPELQLTTETANHTKGDEGPAAWMPPNRAAHCDYAADWVQIATVWHLGLTRADHQALDATLTHC